MWRFFGGEKTTETPRDETETPRDGLTNLKVVFSQKKYVEEVRSDRVTSESARFFNENQLVRSLRFMATKIIPKPVAPFAEGANTCIDVAFVPGDMAVFLWVFSLPK